MAPERHPGLTGDQGEAVGKGGIPVAIMVPEHVGRRDVPRCAGQCADGGVAQWHDPWAGGLGFGQPHLSALDRHLRPFEAADFLLTHSGLGKEPDDPTSHRRSMGDELIDLFGSRIGRPWRRLSDVPLAELPHRIGVDEVPCDCARAEATQGRQITPHGRTLDASLHSITGIIGQSCAGNLIEIQAIEDHIQLAEARAVSFLCPWLHGRQVIVGEAFESFLVVASRPTTTVEPTMLIEKLGEELLGSSLGGGVGGLPHFLAVVLEPHPIGRIALIDGRHWSVLPPCCPV